MKILNLYAGLGGNSLDWGGDVTAVEYTQAIADVYQANHENHQVFVTDAHQFLLEHGQEYDFIWSSPPCQSHSRFTRSGRNRTPRYPDMRLYEEILFLMHDFKGIWVVENVRPYYEPLIKPTAVIGRHVFWSNLNGLEEVEDVKSPANFINKANVQAAEELKEWHGIKYDGSIYYEGNHDPCQVLRNCVHMKIGAQIMALALDKWGDV